MSFHLLHHTIVHLRFVVVPAVTVTATVALTMSIILLACMSIVLLVIIIPLGVLVLVIGVSAWRMIAIAIIIMALRMTRHDYGMRCLQLCDESAFDARTVDAAAQSKQPP